MQKFKRQSKTALTALLSAALSLGLLCHIACTASGCLAAPAANAVAEERVPACHKTVKPKPMAVTLAPFSSLPEHSSHRCADHQTSSLFAQQDGASTKHAKTLLLVIELSALPLLHSVRTVHQTWWPSRKAPPRVARHFQLRI